MVIRCSYLWKADILSSDGVQIFQIHSRAFSDYIVQNIFRGYHFSNQIRPIQMENRFWYPKPHLHGMFKPVQDPETL